ncbi:WD40 repeat-like protein [Suillus weaverae]|nr:WD40 repeat-like protein [Suillus weaverae]
MVTGSDKILCLWDLETGTVLKKMEGHNIEVWALAVSRDGQMIASGDTNGEIIAWHGETGESLTQHIKGHSNAIISLDFSPDGTVLATSGSWEEMTQFWYWDTLTWQQVGHPWEGHTGFINTIVIHPAGTLVASASDDNHVRLWRLSDQHTIAIFQHSSSLQCLTFSADGKHILSGGDDNKISEWAAKGVNAKASFHC